MVVVGPVAGAGPSSATCRYFTALPWVLVSLHLLGSALVWIALLRVPLTLRTAGLQDDRSGAHQQHFSASTATSA